MRDKGMYLTEFELMEVINSMEYFLSYMPMSEKRKLNYRATLRRFKSAYNKRMGKTEGVKGGNSRKL